ncbi:MAG: amidase family protein, partial [Burkholderiales bacterium]
MSVDAVATCLDRAEAAQRTLNPYVTLARDAAIAAARAADALPGARPLRGVPFSVKDNIDTAGLRTTYGSRTLEANVPSVDA